MNTVTSLWGLLILGQTDGAATGSDAAALTGQIQSVWDFVVKGGPMMIPIGICSLVAFAVIVERLVTLRRRNVIPGGFLLGLGKVLDEQGNNDKEAIEYCQESGSPIASIFATGIKRLSEPVELLEKHIQEAGQREVFKLRKYLRALSVIASISPLMGLLGTIFGMIKAFQTVATSGEALGKAELLATGIYEAMITTAAGLLVAIPALIGYHWISACIEQLVSQMDQMTCDFVEQYARTAPAPLSAKSRLPHLVESLDTAEQAAGKVTMAPA